MAPMPTNSSSGNSSFAMPASNSTFRTPISSTPSIDLRDRAGQRQIDQDRAEAHRQQQRGLHIPLDRQIDEDPADQPHHRLLPVEIA